MTTAALSIAFGRVDLLVARRTESGLAPEARSSFHHGPGLGCPGPELSRIGRRIVEAVRTAREHGARDVCTVVLANGRETAVAARLGLAAGTEVRLLRAGDGRALVFAGATAGRPPGEPVVVCALEEGVVDVIAGSVGAAPRWAASIVAAQVRNDPPTVAVRRLAKLVERLALPPRETLLLAGSGSRSLRLALAHEPGTNVHGLAERAQRTSLDALASEYGVSARRARRIVLAATLAAAIARTSGAATEFGTGGLLEGALLDPSWMSARLAPREPLERAELLLSTGLAH
jgi:hypothetical protein